MFNKISAGVMLVSGVLTLTMLQAAIAPDAAVQSMFQHSVDGGLRDVVVRNWGVLIALMGALLIFGAFNPSSRRLALVLAGVSKIAFLALVLAQGQTYLPGLGVAVVADSVMVVLFAIFLIFGRPARAAA